MLNSIFFIKKSSAFFIPSDWKMDFLHSRPSSFEAVAQHVKTALVLRIQESFSNTRTAKNGLFLPNMFERTAWRTARTQNTAARV